jgi:hypothetical protein
MLRARCKGRLLRRHVAAGIPSICGLRGLIRVVRDTAMERCDRRARGLCALTARRLAGHLLRLSGIELRRWCRTFSGSGAQPPMGLRAPGRDLGTCRGMGHLSSHPRLRTLRARKCDRREPAPRGPESAQRTIRLHPRLAPTRRPQARDGSSRRYVATGACRTLPARWEGRVRASAVPGHAERGKHGGTRTTRG